MLELLDQYSDKGKCRDKLFQLRWPRGFLCPGCGGHSYCELKSLRLHQCNRYHHQGSLTAGTIFHDARLPRGKRVLAFYLLPQPKKNLSALELKRQLGFRYDTAWSLTHNLMRQAAQNPASKRVNTVLGNVISAIRGAFHVFSAKHAPHYLAEFEYQFNRGFHLPDTIQMIMYVSLRTLPMPYRPLMLAEPIRQSGNDMSFTDDCSGSSGGS